MSERWVEPWVLEGAIDQRDQARRLVERLMTGSPRELEKARRAAEKAIAKWGRT